MLVDSPKLDKTGTSITFQKIFEEHSSNNTASLNSPKLDNTSNIFQNDYCSSNTCSDVDCSGKEHFLDRSDKTMLVDSPKLDRTDTFITFQKIFEEHSSNKTLSLNGNSPDSDKPNRISQNYFGSPDNDVDCSGKGCFGNSSGKTILGDSPKLDRTGSSTTFQKIFEEHSSNKTVSLRPTVNSPELDKTNSVSQNDHGSPNSDVDCSDKECFGDSSDKVNRPDISFQEDDDSSGDDSDVDCTTEDSFGETFSLKKAMPVDSPKLNRTATPITLQKDDSSSSGTSTSGHLSLEKSSKESMSGSSHKLDKTTGSLKSGSDDTSTEDEDMNVDCGNKNPSHEDDRHRQAVGGCNVHQNPSHKDSGMCKSFLETSQDDIKPRRPWRGVIADPKTLFVKNLSPSITQEDLKKAMTRFGPVKYVDLKSDNHTGCSKGIAYIAFHEAEDAEKCLKEGKMVLHRKVIFMSIALTKEQLWVYHKQKIPFHAMKSASVLHRVDSRNLFLRNEGYIKPESEAAEGVSKDDLIKRLQRELTKNRSLEDKHSFVSPIRLFVDNLPLSLYDYDLEKLLLRAVDDEHAEIIEASIKRDKDGKSLGCGFVTFTRHEHALEALRNLNNNPGIFTLQRRPLIDFSVEYDDFSNALLKNLEITLPPETSKPQGGNSIRMQKRGNHVRTSTCQGKKATPVHTYFVDDDDDDESSPEKREVCHTPDKMDSILQSSSRFQAEEGIEKIKASSQPSTSFVIDSSKNTSYQLLMESSGVDETTLVYRIHDREQSTIVVREVNPEVNLVTPSRRKQNESERLRETSGESEYQVLVKKYKSPVHSWKVVKRTGISKKFRKK